MFQALPDVVEINPLKTLPLSKLGTVGNALLAGLPPLANIPACKSTYTLVYAQS